MLEDFLDRLQIQRHVRHLPQRARRLPGLRFRDAAPERRRAGRVGHRVGRDGDRGARRDGVQGTRVGPPEAVLAEALLDLPPDDALHLPARPAEVGVLDDGLAALGHEVADVVGDGFGAVEAADLVEAGEDAADDDDGADDEGGLDDVVGCDVAAGYLVDGGGDAAAEDGAARGAEEDGGPVAVFVAEEVAELLVGYEVGRRRGGIVSADEATFEELVPFCKGQPGDRRGVVGIVWIRGFSGMSQGIEVIDHVAELGVVGSRTIGECINAYVSSKCKASAAA